MGKNNQNVPNCKSHEQSKPILNSNARRLLSEDGWNRRNVGESEQVNYNSRFDLYIRRRRLAALTHGKTESSPDVTDEIFRRSSKRKSEKVSDTNDSAMVPNTPLGGQKTDLAPKATVQLPVLSDFGSYPSLAAIRSNTSSLVISFDSEWYYPGGSQYGDRAILSWQFACIQGDELVEFIFLRKSSFNLSLELALGRILDHLEAPCVDLRKVRRYKSLGDVDPSTGLRIERVYNSAQEADKNSLAVYDDGKRHHTWRDGNSVTTIPVTLLCHAGIVDLSTFDQSSAYCMDFLPRCQSVHSGIVTMQPFSLHPKSVRPVYAKNKNSHAYPVALSIADTLCHVPSKDRSLAAMGKAIGFEKVELPHKVKEHMDMLLREDPRRYFEYASTDSVVTLLYGSALYGYNAVYPITITSATAACVKESLMEYLGCQSDRDFNRVYRGLKQVGHGLFPMSNRPGYLKSTSLEPISMQANIVQKFASGAYHGGYNGCSAVGYFPFKTSDYDLRNAYPTAMCLVADVDWENPVRREIQNCQLTLQDFLLPFGSYDTCAPLLASVQFEFPQDVVYPCIPVYQNGSLIYPRTSAGLDEVLACGPELYLALQLGAVVTVKQGYFLNNLMKDNGHGIPEPSHSLAFAVRQLVQDRSEAVAAHGKECLEQKILKEMVSSVYGKAGQNVIPKHSWSAISDEMKALGCSPITNPVVACLTTSIVRAVLLAAQNQCNALGYMTCSVTTDGFISDIPKETLKGLDLYGLRKRMEEARLFLTNQEDSELWEKKHEQTDLVNFTTRGNVSLSDFGVCAHNGAKSGHKSDSYEDRYWLMKSVLSRSGSVEFKHDEWTSLKDLVHGNPFRITLVRKKISMDFDMKRKPLRNSFESRYPVIDGKTYEIAYFTTEPFESIVEYDFYRQKKELVNVLRTMDDWKFFWIKVDSHDTGAKIRNADWAILNSCIMYHRAGLCCIPKLDELRGRERNDWINSHNTSDHIFTDDDWKHAGQRKRREHMLAPEVIKDKLAELINDSDTDTVH